MMIPGLGSAAAVGEIAPQHVGKGDLPDKFRYGFCLEPQRVPNGPNQPNFASAVSKPGLQFPSTTSDRFSRRK
jgi:galactose mutarotase-like enzyme